MKDNAAGNWVSGIFYDGKVIKVQEKKDLISNLERLKFEVAQEMGLSKKPKTEDKQNEKEIEKDIK